MRAVAVIDSQEPPNQEQSLNEISKCFTSEALGIQKMDSVWILRSTELSNAKDRDEAFQLADTQIDIVNQICTICLSMTHPLRVVYILWLDEQGNPLRRSIRETFEFNVYSGKAALALGEIRGGSSIGSLLAREAIQTPYLCHGIGIIGKNWPSWSQIYDVIEFLGGQRRIADTGWAERTEVRRIRQTANYYRHLGTRGKYPLPETPPSLADAANSTLVLLRRWIHEQTGLPIAETL